VYRLAPPKVRNVGAPAAHFDQERVPPGKRLVPAERLTNRDVSESVFFRAFDDLELDSGAQPHLIEEAIAVGRFANRAGGDGAVLLDAVAVHDLAETLERFKRRLHGRRAQAVVGEGVLAQQHAPRDVLQHPGRAVGGCFRQ
jgi:hypothetical protein